MVIRLYNFIQSYLAIRDFYNKALLIIEYLLIYLSYKRKKVIDQANIYINVNINRKDRAKINQFRDEISKVF